jgi:hypothetical protein
MIQTAPSIDVTDYRQFVVWLIAMLIVGFGFRYAKEVIAFALDKLYQFFIQNHGSL